MELLLDRVETWYNFEKGCHEVKIGVILFYIAAICALYYLFKISRINVIWGMVIALIAYLLLCEYCMRSNPNFASQVMTPEAATRIAKHGDIVLFRSYENYDIPELLFYRHLNAIMNSTLFGHIGIVLEINGRKYILESTEDEHYNDLVGYYKNGTLIQDFYKRVMEYHGRVHLVPSTIGEYMRDEKRIRDYIDKMKHVPFVSKNGGISCLFLIRNLMNLFDLLKKPNSFPMSPKFFVEKKNYKVDVEFDEPVTVSNKYFMQNLYMR